MRPFEANLEISFTGVCPERSGPVAWGWTWNDRGTGELQSGGGYRDACPSNTGIAAALFGLGTGLAAALGRTPSGRPGVLLQTDHAPAVELLMNGIDNRDADALVREAWSRIAVLLKRCGPPDGVLTQLVTGEEISLAVRQAGEWWDRGQRRQGRPTTEAA